MIAIGLAPLKMSPTSSSSSSFSTPSLKSKWQNLPTDILTTIATIIGPTIGHLRLRSICSSWRAALPLPVSPPAPSPLRRHVHLLLTDPATHTTTLSPSPATLNLLDYGVTFIDVSFSPRESFRKSLVLHDGVLGLTRDGRVFFRDARGGEWVYFVHNSVRFFDDIAVYKGGFYATADRRGRLVRIEVCQGEVKGVDVLHKLMYGCGFNTSLVGCDFGLFLVDRGSVYDKEFQIEVYKLDDKGRFWDYEYDLGGCVFFLGASVNLSLSPKDYCGSVRDVIYFEHGDDGVKVWDVKTGVVCSLADNEACRELFEPPSSWFDRSVAGV